MHRMILTAACVSLLALAACSSKSSETGTTEPPAPEPPTTAPANQTSGLGDIKMPEGLPDVTLAAFEGKEVEVGCGMCTYHMDGVKSCATAIMVDGNHVLITGQWANAHSLGLCGGPSKKAVATAKLTDGKLEVTELAITQ